MRNAVVAVLVFALLSCHASTKATMPSVTAPIVMTVIAPPVVTKPVESKPNPPYRAGIRSVVLLKDTALHKQPRLDSALVGIVRRGTHSGVKQAIDSSDCGASGRWIELAPRGWTCETSVEPSEAAPTEDEPLADDVDPIRGVYGMVRGHASAYANRDDAAAQENAMVLDGSNTVRAAGVVAVDGHRYWRTSAGALIDEASIYQISPSRFKGIEMMDTDALPAWVRAHGDPYKPATTRDAPHGKPNGTLARRTVVTVLETSGDWVRIADATWIARADLRIASLAAPPPGTGDDEKWFDVDRDEQVLVAYQGTRPVYATLVSTGKWQHETQLGVARIASKHETAVMSSDASKGAVYSVADVPWTMYYDRDFALHTSYWHDGFGGVMSHGCVNLSPRDARLLYHWSSPDVPPGWTTVYGDTDNPGSLVRVRSKTTPNPSFRGYARDLVATK